MYVARHVNYIGLMTAANSLDGIHCVHVVTFLDILWQSSLIIINLFTMLLETLSLRPRCIFDLFFVSMRTCCHKSIVVPFSFLNIKRDTNWKQNFRLCSRINKLMSVIFCVCPGNDHEFHHSIVKVQCSCGSTRWYCFITITNYQIVCYCSLYQHGINYKFMCVCPLIDNEN